MPHRHMPFWNRPDSTSSYFGVRQVMNTCVFAANAGAVNHLVQRQVWTLGSLIDVAASEGYWKGGPAVGSLAHKPVKSEVDYFFNFGFPGGQLKQATDGPSPLVTIAEFVRVTASSWHLVFPVAAVPC